MEGEVYRRAEIFLQIYNDQCGLEIVGRHGDLGVAKKERGDLEMLSVCVSEAELRELDTTPPFRGARDDHMIFCSTTILSFVFINRKDLCIRGRILRHLFISWSKY